jgi:hypothetical protein
MRTAFQNKLETRHDEFLGLLDKTSSRVSSSEHAQRIPHAAHHSWNVMNRTTTICSSCSINSVHTQKYRDNGIATDKEVLRRWHLILNCEDGSVHTNPTNM